MQARVTQAFDGMPDGSKRSRKFATGEIIEGDLARTAVDNGLAKEVAEAPPAPSKPPVPAAAQAGAASPAPKSKAKGPAPGAPKGAPDGEAP